MSVPWFVSEASTVAGFAIGLSPKVIPTSDSIRCLVLVSCSETGGQDDEADGSADDEVVGSGLDCSASRVDRGLDSSASAVEECVELEINVEPDLDKHFDLQLK